MMYIVISYDIKDDARRLKIFKALKDFGAWVQYSVFECNLSKTELLKLRHRLKQLTAEHPDDSVRLYSLCADCQSKIERIGGVRPPEEGSVIV